MSVYRVTEPIGTSSVLWEDAAASAVKTAAQTLRDLRVAEVVEQDIPLEEGGHPSRGRWRDHLSHEAASFAQVRGPVTWVTAACRACRLW